MGTWVFCVQDKTPSLLCSHHGPFMTFIILMPLKLHLLSPAPGQAWPHEGIMVVRFQILGPQNLVPGQGARGPPHRLQETKFNSQKLRSFAFRRRGEGNYLAVPQSQGSGPHHSSSGPHSDMRKLGTALCKFQGQPEHSGRPL